MSEAFLPYSDPSFRDTNKQTTHPSPSCWFPPQLTSLGPSKNQAVLLQEATPFFLLHIFASSLTHLFSFSRRTPGVSARLHNFSDKWQKQMVSTAKYKGRYILLQWVKDLLLLQQLTTALLPHSSMCGTDLGVSQLLRPSWDCNMQDYRILRGSNFHSTFPGFDAHIFLLHWNHQYPRNIIVSWRKKLKRHQPILQQKLIVVIKNLHQYTET